MPESSKTITLSADLHARPAGALAVAAAGFAATVSVSTGTKTADAKSVLGAMGLGATAGQQVTVAADGPDAAAAVTALIAILAGAAPSAAKWLTIAFPNHHQRFPSHLLIAGNCPNLPYPATHPCATANSLTMILLPSLLVVSGAQGEGSALPGDVWCTIGGVAWTVARLSGATA